MVRRGWTSESRRCFEIAVTTRGPRWVEADPGTGYKGAMEVTGLEIVADRTEGSLADEGFLDRYDGPDNFPMP